MVRPRGKRPALPPAGGVMARTGVPAVVLARISGVLESIASPAAVVDGSGTIIAVNPAWSTVGHTATLNAEYARASDPAHPADAARIRAGVAAVLDGDESTFEHTYHRSARFGGKGIVHVTPIAGAGEPAALIIHSSPIDEVEVRGDGTESRLRAVFDGAGMAIAVIDL